MKRLIEVVRLALRFPTTKDWRSSSQGHDWDTATRKAVDEVVQSEEWKDFVQRQSAKGGALVMDGMGTFPDHLDNSLIDIFVLKPSEIRRCLNDNSGQASP
jgi:hypothetical protein